MVRLYSRQLLPDSARFSNAKSAIFPTPRKSKSSTTSVVSSLHKLPVNQLLSTPTLSRCGKHPFKVKVCMGAVAIFSKLCLLRISLIHCLRHRRSSCNSSVSRLNQSLPNSLLALLNINLQFRCSLFMELLLKQTGLRALA